MYIYKRMLMLIENLNEDQIDYKIAHYIVYYHQDIMKMTVREIAEKTYVSPSAIIRFINKLGFSEFNMFKKALFFDMESSIERMSHSGLTLVDYMKLMDTYNKMIESDYINQLIECLKSSKEIVFYFENGYWDILGPLIFKLRSLKKEVYNLSFKNNNVQEEIVEKIDQTGTIVLVFPSKEYALLGLNHLELGNKTLNYIENKECHKFYLGRLDLNEINTYHHIDIPYMEQYLLYNILITLLVDYIMQKTNA